MTILALDTSATRTGWASGPACGPVNTGSASFKGHGLDIGSLLVAFRDWLHVRIDEEGPEMVAFEKPVLFGRQGNLTTLRQLYSIAGLVEMVAKDRAVPCFEIDTGQMKKLIYGRGGKKPRFNEGRVLAGQWGFDPDNMDEADACGVWLMTVKHRYADYFEEWERRRAAARVKSGEAML